MTRDAGPVTGGSYAPFELELNAAAIGLTVTTVTTGLGRCVLRHRALRSSTVATVFLHGAAGSWSTWTPLLQAAGAGGFDEPVLLDLPGFGDSILDDSGDDLTVDSIAAFVREGVEALGYTSWRLMGHSLGGSIALHLAATAPAHTVSVQVISPTIFSVIRSIDHPVRNFLEIPAFTVLLAVMRFLARLGAAGFALVRFGDPVGAHPLPRGRSHG